MSQADLGGGGAGIMAWNLHRQYRQRGVDSWMAVDRKLSDDPNVVSVRERFVGRWAAFWSGVAKSVESASRPSIIAELLRSIGSPVRRLKGAASVLRGMENWEYPWTYRTADVVSPRPDVLHCHNLHGGFFDLRAIPFLARQFPVLITLHDAWLLGGHCAHSLDCDRWKTGCGRCPRIDIDLPMRRDASAANWRRRQKVFSCCRIWVASPSRWLLDRAKESLLAQATVEARTIPNGVDLTVFKPGDRQEVRRRMGIDAGAKILLFVANNVLGNVWKDSRTLVKSVERVASKMSGNSRLILIALGGQGASSQIGNVHVQFIRYQPDRNMVADYYRACDIYVHAALADTFPTTVVEALACGRAVVATAVGGISEQVKSLAHPGRASAMDAVYDPSEATGILVEPGNELEMAEAITMLLGNRGLLDTLGANAAADAESRFGEERQVASYLSLYTDMIEEWRGGFR